MTYWQTYLPTNKHTLLMGCWQTYLPTNKHTLLKGCLATTKKLINHLPIYLQYGKTERDRAALNSRCHKISLRAPILKHPPTPQQQLSMRKHYGMTQNVPYILLPPYKVEPYCILELWLRVFKTVHANPPGLGEHEILQNSPFKTDQ